MLEIVEGPRAGDRLALEGPVVLGREPGLPHALDDDQVSRHHARVTPSGASARVEDLGSLNGTYLNGSPLETAATVNAGDRIRIGLTVFEVRRQSDLGRGTVAAPVPRLSQVGADVLRPVEGRELAAVQAPRYGAVLAETTDPRYVPSGVDGRIDQNSPASSDESGYAAVARLVDVRVKRRTNVSAFALLSIVSLVVIIYFGAT